MSTGIGIVNTSGLQQNNFFVLDDPTSASSTNGTGSTSGGLQSFLDQLQSLVGSDATTPSTTFVGAGLPVSTPAQSDESNNDVAEKDSTQAQPEHVGDHHHGHHHHMQTGTTSATSGSISASNLQSDVSKLVNDMFSMLQQTGPSAVTSSTTPANVAPAVTASVTAVSTPTSSSTGEPVSTSSAINTTASSLQNDTNQLVSNLFSILQQIESGAGAVSASVGSPPTQTTTDPTQSAQSIAASDPTSSSTSSVIGQTPVQVDSTSLATLESIVAQDFVNAIQAYGSANSLPSIQSTTTTA